MALVGTALSLALSAPCQANTTIPMTLRDLVRASDEIFAGTVSSVKTTKNRHAGLVSMIRFENVRYLKTRRRRTQAVLTIQGGRVGNSETFLMGIPRFQRGQRYVLFTDSLMGSPADSYVPFIGLDQGIFLVNGQRQVMDSSGRPLLKVVHGRAVVLGGPVTPESKLIKPILGHAGGHGVEVAESSADSIPDSQLPPPLRGYGVSTYMGTYVASRDHGERVTEAEFLKALREL